jgi:calcineurin-like phosphoesterase family protein
MHRLLLLKTSFLLLLTVTSSVSIAAAADDTWSDVERVVAFGDIHGDYEKFTAMLQSAGLVDTRLKWRGGSTHFVQLGDVTDRGPESRKIVDLIMSLEKQAGRARGAVHFVIGNHEAMNMVGDLRYVHPGEYEAFRTSKSRSVRNQVYKNHVTFVKKNVAEEEWPVFNPAYREKWDTEHPLGWVELRRAWGPGGKYGKWLVKHHGVIRINDMLFAHGGIGPKFVETSRKSLNDQISADLKTGLFDSDGLLMDSEGPLWYRGLAMNPEDEEAPHLEALMATHGVSHVVIAHTPLTGTILPRFGNKVVLIDVGLGAYYGSREAYLEATSEGLFVFHRGAKLTLPSEGGQELIDYLKEAAALDPEPSPIQAMITSLEDGE